MGKIWLATASTANLHVSSSVHENTLIPRAGGQEGGIRGEMAAPDDALVLSEPSQLLPSMDIPNPHCLVTGASGNKGRVQTEATAPDVPSVSNQSGC